MLTPLHFEYFHQMICEPLEIVKPPSFGDHLRGLGVDTTELPTPS
jgi:hypothetical protein